MMLLQPRSTLFPYTTLFRSDQVDAAIRQALHVGRVAFLKPAVGKPELLCPLVACGDQVARYIQAQHVGAALRRRDGGGSVTARSEEHTSELQSRLHLVCRLL